MKTRTSAFIQDNNAVSDLIGEVLMTAIAVLAFSVIAVFVFSYIGTDEKVHANIDGWVDVGSDTIYLRHSGGENIDLNNMQILLNLNGTRRELSSSQLMQIFGDNSWHLGEAMRIDTDIMWNTTINENDYVGMILLETDSRIIVESVSLLGDEFGMTSCTGYGSGEYSTDGNLAWWKFNENSGNTAIDSIGGYDGNIFQAGWTTGINGSALEFDGTNDYVMVNEQIINDYPFTISAWIKTKSSGSNKAIVNLADPSLPNSYYGIDMRSNGKVRLIARNTNNRVITGDSINDGEWHNLVAVFNSSIDRKLYLDGIINGTHTTAVTFNNGTDRWSVGRWGDSSPSAYFDGAIDEVRLWDSALDASEILQFYEAYVIGPEPPATDVQIPVSRWKFNENFGSVAYDSVGTNDAQLVNAQWSNTAINGTAIMFDGNSDYLRVSDDNSLDFDQNMSILFWLRLTTNNDATVIGKGLNDLDNFELFVSGGELYFEWANSASNFVQTTGMGLQTNTWYQIGVAVDETNVHFYKDGTFVEFHSMTGVPLISNNNELWMGRQNDGSNNFYMQGYLDEVEIYNVTLSGSDIADYYTRTNP
jgi:FlaG/FlaF family flagellin (archaellin)